MLRLEFEALCLLLFTYQASGNCRLGVLQVLRGAKWSISTQVTVTSVLPDIIPPSDSTDESQKAPVASEEMIFVEARPPIPPSTAARLCIRSLSSLATACQGKQALSAQAGSTNPESFIYNATEGVPMGPCLQLTADDTVASLDVEKSHPDSCWPGAGYCTDVSWSYSLTRSSITDSKHLPTFKLHLSRLWSTYQDTDGRYRTFNATLQYQLVEGCALKLHADNTTADPSTSYCLGCSGQRARLTKAASSNNCVRCPVRSSKIAAAASKIKAAGTEGIQWQCVPGMPKGFESIAVRMGQGGNPECASVNGKTCLRQLNNNSTSCRAMLPVLNSKWPLVGQGALTTVNGPMKPLRCGSAHEAVWAGVTGYSSINHWCTVVREWLQDRQPLVQGKCLSRP